MSIKVTKNDVMWSYGNLFLTSAINILLLPFVLRALSSSEMGLWYIFTSIGSLASLVDFGLVTTISRNVTFVWCGAKKITKEGYEINDKLIKPNYYLIYKMISCFQLLYLCIGVVVFLVISTAGTIFIIYTTKGMLLWNEYIPAWFLYAMAITLNIYYAYWNPLLKGVGAIKQSNQINVYGKVTQLVVCIIGLAFGLGLNAVAMAYLISNIVTRFFAKRLFNNYEDIKVHLKKYRGIRIPKNEAKELFLSIWPNAYKQGLISISSFVQQKAGTLIASAFLGLESASLLGLTQQIYDLIMSVGNALFNTYIPMLSQQRVLGDKKKLLQYYSQSVGVAVYIIMFGGIASIFLSPYLLNIIGSETQILTLYPALALLINNLLVNNHILSGAFLATGNRVPMYKSYVITASCVVALQLILCQFTNIGVWGLIVPGIICQIIYNNWYWPLKASEELGENIWRVIINVLTAPFRMLFGLTNQLFNDLFMHESKKI